MDNQQVTWLQAGGFIIHNDESLFKENKKIPPFRRNQCGAQIPQRLQEHIPWWDEDIVQFTSPGRVALPGVALLVIREVFCLCSGV
jgi:hypothetical protein